MTTSQQSGSQFKTLRPYRLLVSWLSDQEQAAVLSENRALSVTALAQKKAEHQAALAARPPYAPSSPFTPIEDVALREALAGRLDIQGSLQELSGELIMVDLKQILAFQPGVCTEGLEERIAPALADPNQLVELCFPSQCSTELNWGQDAGGFVLVSSNPNVVLGPGQWQSLPPNNPILMFSVLSNRNHLLVASYQGRHFLRDGYHRSTALLRAGIERVPCIHMQAQSLEEIGWKPGMLRPEQFLGERPPSLVDFWDETVSCSVLRPATRRVSRVHVDTFDIGA